MLTMHLFNSKLTNAFYSISEFLDSRYHWVQFIFDFEFCYWAKQMHTNLYKCYILYNCIFIPTIFFVLPSNCCAYIVVFSKLIGNWMCMLRMNCFFLFNRIYFCSESNTICNIVNIHNTQQKKKQSKNETKKK